MNLSHPWSWYKNGEGVRWKLDRQIHRIREVVLKTRIGAFGFAQHTDIGTLSMLTASCPVTQSLRWSFLKSVDSSKRSELESIFWATLEFRIEVLPTQNFPFRVVIEGNFFFFWHRDSQVHREPIHHERHHVFSTTTDQLQYGRWDAVSLWSKLASWWFFWCSNPSWIFRVFKWPAFFRGVKRPTR